MRPAYGAGVGRRVEGLEIGKLLRARSDLENIAYAGVPYSDGRGGNYSRPANQTRQFLTSGDD